MHYNVIINYRYTMDLIIKMAGCIQLWILLMGVCEGYGQSNRSQSILRINGVQGIEVMGGLSDLGYIGSVGYGRFFAKGWYAKAVLTYERDSDDRFDNTTLSVDLLASRNLLPLRRVFFNLLLGSTVAIENLDGFRSEKRLNQTSVGAATGLEVEYYLFNNVAMITQGITRTLFSSNTGKSRYYAALGVRMTF